MNLAMRPSWIDRLGLVIVAVVVTAIAEANLENLCDAWLCTSLPVQEFVRTWVVPTGLVAATAFALGIPAVGLALSGTLVGAVIGEPVGGWFFQRAPFGAALGASLGTCAGGLLGLRALRSMRPSRTTGFSWFLRLSAVATLGAGLAASWGVPGMIAAADPVCRAPSIGGLCHRHVIALLMVADAAFIGVLFMLAARSKTRTTPPLAPA